LFLLLDFKVKFNVPFLRRLPYDSFLMNVEILFTNLSFELLYDVNGMIVISFKSIWVQFTHAHPSRRIRILIYIPCICQIVYKVTMVKMCKFLSVNVKYYLVFKSSVCSVEIPQIPIRTLLRQLASFY
jgi:hypothetical protein